MKEQDREYHGMTVFKLGSRGFLKINYDGF